MVKVTERSDGTTVEAYEDRGPTRAVSYGDVDDIAVKGYITGERLA